MRFLFIALILSVGSGISLADSIQKHTETSRPGRFKKLDINLNHWAEGQIQFWFRVYTEVSSEEWLLHDTMDLSRVYEVVKSRKDLGTELAKIRGALKSLSKKLSHQKSPVKISELNLSERELRYYKIHQKNNDPRAYRFAAAQGRIRSQQGQRDRLDHGYAVSKAYLPRMEQIFEEEGVPKSITRLPFVESAFAQHAVSSVGAAGLWQFMPKTAMRDLKVGRVIDERYDPLKSTRAAARFLSDNHKRLKSWSLAIMAYHHGPGLVESAMKRLNTRDPIQITKVFKHPRFRFASRNYLFEFLAMLDVDSAHEKFFTKKPRVLPKHITVSFEEPLHFKTIVKRYEIAIDALRELNPQLREVFWKNQSTLPPHYSIRLPRISLKEFRNRSH